jgi:hypothetical protein
MRTKRATRGVGSARRHAVIRGNYYLVRGPLGRRPNEPFHTPHCGRGRRALINVGPLRSSLFDRIRDTAIAVTMPSRTSSVGGASLAATVGRQPPTASNSFPTDR